MILGVVLLVTSSDSSKIPTAAPNNGAAYYLDAARLVEGKAWAGVDFGPPEKKKIEVVRNEVSQANPILQLLIKGNGMQVAEYRKATTFADPMFEFGPFRKLCAIACDAAYVEASDGQLDSASQWLVQADRFAERVPLETMFGLRVREAMLQSLRRTTEELLPRFEPKQLQEQTAELQSIAINPPDALAAVQGNREALDRTIPILVANPQILGIKFDEAPDLPGGFDKVVEAIKTSETIRRTLEKIFKSAPPEVQRDNKSLLIFLTKSEAKVPKNQRGDFRKFLEMFRFAANPPTYSLSAFAKTLSTSSRAHAEKVLKLTCDPAMDSLLSALSRPESSWWTPAAATEGQPMIDQMKSDSSRLEFGKVDMYALQLSNFLSLISDVGYEHPLVDWPRILLLDREKCRIAVVDAGIWSFQATHHRLPTTLQEIGNPVDPLSKQPYAYRTTSESTYELAATGIPGVGEITGKTTLPPEK